MKGLDLFAGAGGCSMGYHRAGFEMTGVDHRPQPNYPFRFVQADALEYVAEHGHEFDFIAASPPCQAFSAARTIHGVGNHLDLLTPTRVLLIASGLPWVIENVPGAPMRRDVVLCGSMFPPLRVRRHRWFEFSAPPAHLVPPCHHKKTDVSVFGHGGHVYHGVADWRDAMGIDWMTRDELSQAIPPAYCELIGSMLLQSLRAVA